MIIVQIVFGAMLSRLNSVSNPVKLIAAVAEKLN